MVRGATLLASLLLISGGVSAFPTTAPPAADAATLQTWVFDCDRPLDVGSLVVVQRVELRPLEDCEGPKLLQITGELLHIRPGGLLRLPDGAPGQAQTMRACHETAEAMGMSGEDGWGIDLHVERLVIDGPLHLGNGGRGGDAVALACAGTDAWAQAGDGGLAGALLVDGQAVDPRDWDLLGGIGGSGGDARAASGPQDGTARGENGTAVVDPNGGNAGLATGGARGSGAHGGNATAIGGQGAVGTTWGGLGGNADAIASAGNPGYFHQASDQKRDGGHGGWATAIGGDGGPGLNGGGGGYANATGGAGGYGASIFWVEGLGEAPKAGNGGDSGDADATGGRGGIGAIRGGDGGWADARAHNAGYGGNATVVGGLGGNGGSGGAAYATAGFGDLSPGGQGGSGGSAEAQSGRGGSGGHASGSPGLGGQGGGADGIGGDGAFGMFGGNGGSATATSGGAGANGALFPPQSGPPDKIVQDDLSTEWLDDRSQEAHSATDSEDDEAAMPATPIGAGAILVAIAAARRRHRLTT
ncbi:MAG: hypothetical protein ACPGQL_00365 [Thermoplasmatota archaeon]